MDPQRWIIDCLKIYKIPDKVMKFTEKTSLAEVKIQRGIFQGDTLSPLLFVIVMMPRNNILRKCTGGHNYINHEKKSTT